MGAGSGHRRTRHDRRSVHRHHSTPVDSASSSGFLFASTPVTVTAAGVQRAQSHAFLGHVDQLRDASIFSWLTAVYFDVSTDAAFLPRR